MVAVAMAAAAATAVRLQSPGKGTQVGFNEEKKRDATQDAEPQREVGQCVRVFSVVVIMAMIVVVIVVAMIMAAAVPLSVRKQVEEDVAEHAADGKRHKHAQGTRANVKV